MWLLLECWIVLVYMEIEVFCSPVNHPFVAWNCIMECGMWKWLNVVVFIYSVRQTIIRIAPYRITNVYLIAFRTFMSYVLFALWCLSFIWYTNFTNKVESEINGMLNVASILMQTTSDKVFQTDGWNRRWMTFGKTCWNTINLYFSNNKHSHQN